MVEQISYITKYEFMSYFVSNRQWTKMFTSIILAK